MIKIKEPHKILSIAIIGKLQRKTYSCRETAPFSEESGCNIQYKGDRRPVTTVQQKSHRERLPAREMVAQVTCLPLEPET